MNAGLGLLLSVGMAVVFGVSRDVDALFVAMSVAVFLARDLSRVIRTAAVPCLVESDEGRGDPDFAAEFLTVVVILAAAASLFVWGGASVVVQLTSPGFDPVDARAAQHLLRLLAPSLLLFMLFGAAQSVFHSRRRFLAPELGETLWRAIAIAALFTVGRPRGVEAFAATLTLAAFAQWGLLLAVGLRDGLRVLPAHWRLPRPRRLLPFWLGASVVLCSVLQLQVEGALDRGVISFMAPGSIALISYADRLAHMLPLLLSTSLLTPWLPEIARIRLRVGDPRRLAKQGSLFLAALGALLAVVIVWAARDAVEFLLLRGKFDAAAAEIVIAAMQAFALGTPAIFCVQCLAGLYIVERDFAGMLRMGVVAVLAHAAGNLALCHWGVPGIALSGSLTIWLVALYLWRRIGCREQVWFPRVRCAAGLLAALGVLYGIPWRSVLPWAPLRLGVGAALAWVVYTAVMWPAIRRMQEYERTATDPAFGTGNPGSDQKLPEP